jgi:hypothetical protein
MDVLADSGILLRLLEPTDPHHATIDYAVRVLHARGDRIVLILILIFIFILPACWVDGPAFSALGARVCVELYLSSAMVTRPTGVRPMRYAPCQRNCSAHF